MVSDKYNLSNIISLIQMLGKKIHPIYYLGDGLVRTIDVQSQRRSSINWQNRRRNPLFSSWKLLAPHCTLSHKLDVQVLATSHSYECLVAAHKALSKTEEHDLKVYKLERHSRGRCQKKLKNLAPRSAGVMCYENQFFLIERKSIMLLI